MRRTARAVAAALLLAATAAPAAGAHPLGNFSVNRLDVVRVHDDRVDVRWILDQAEIPTFQERGRPAAELLAAKRAVAARSVRLEVDGRPAALRLLPGGRLTRPPGAGGLPTLRVELLLRARVADPGRVTLRDASFADRVGWRAIVVRPGRGTAVRADVPSADPTGGLRRYPRDLLSSPPDQRSATLTVRPGSGEVVAPRAEGGGLETTGDRGGDDGFAGLLEDAAAGRGALVLLLLAAAGWGALHALSPGHGKGMVAAYLVGTRGTRRDAVLLGLTVTVSHTIGVFALGLVALSLSAYVVPEDLYPWLTLASGALVVGVGASVLRRRREAHAHAHHHHHHQHEHEHDGSRRGLLALGASAGLLPCPSALVVLLAAVAQHEVALGLLLIVAFSGGLAATLTALGLAVVGARRLTSRLPASPVVTAIARAAPSVSAVLIVGVGFAIALRAIPDL